jgi:hypothetical protein
MLCLYAALYVSYISVILLWSILGAVLNPEKFLPIATGAIVVIVFLGYMYAKLSSINKTLIDVVKSVINDEIKGTMIENFQNKYSDVSKIISQAESLPQSMFHKAINAYMGANNLQSVDKSVTDEIMNGNAGAIATLLNNSLGIDYSIALGLVGVLKDDPIVIMDSIYKLSETLNLDPELNIAIAEIILDKYNPDNLDKDQVSNSVILSIKKLLHHFFPDFQSEILDVMLQVTIKQDIAPLKKMLRQLGAPSELLELIIAFVKKDKPNIQKAIETLSKNTISEY